MGKGIKMRSAQDRHGNVYSVDALQAMHDNRQSIPDLRCDYPPCGCDVRFVQRHQQNRANRIEPIDVPAYIGLTSDSEHITGCRYDAPGQIRAIVAQSDPDFLNALDSGKRELRLLMLHNGLKGSSLSGSTSVLGGKPPAGVSGGQSTTSFTQTDEKLSSYLRTTADLVKLRTLCETDALLASELILRFGNKRIAWSQFFFEKGSYDDAWDLVKASGANAYPIALTGVVKSHFVPGPMAKHKNSFLNCRLDYRRTDNPDRLEEFEVSIMHPDGKWLTTFPAGTEVVMLGIWKHTEAVERQYKNPQDSRITTYVTHKLTLQPKFKRQVIMVA